MHFLDKKDLVAFGLTSHRLHADADTGFAWKCHKAYEVKLCAPISGKFDGVRLARSLLRHLPVHVDAYCPSDIFGSSPISLIASIMSIQRIVSLTLWNIRPEYERNLKAMVDHPTAMQDLTVVHLDWSGLKVFSEAAGAGKLPSLTHLEFLDDADSWATQILRFPRLRFLHIRSASLKKSVHRKQS